MWTSRDLDEIQAFIDSDYYNYDDRLIGIICGNMKDPEFDKNYRHLLPTFNFSSRNLVDFFWIGSEDNRQQIDSKLNIDEVNYSEELRTKSTIELGEKLGRGRYYLLSGFKLVALPVRMKKIIFSEGVIIDLKSLSNSGIEPLDSFHALLEYAESGNRVDEQGIERSQKDLTSGLKNAEGIRDKMQSAASVIGKDVAAQAITAGVVAVTHVVGNMLKG